MFTKVFLDQLHYGDTGNLENLMCQIGKGRNPGTSSLSSLDPCSDPIPNILAGR